MIEQLKTDSRPDTSITIPGSVKVLNEEGNPYCELDGLIIHPNRKDDQVIFLEAKNRKWKTEKGKSELIKKLRKLKLPFHEADIQIVNKDCSISFSIVH